MMELDVYVVFIFQSEVSQYNQYHILCKRTSEVHIDTLVIDLLATGGICSENLQV